MFRGHSGPSEEAIYDEKNQLWKLLRKKLPTAWTIDLLLFQQFDTSGLNLLKILIMKNY